MMLASRIRVARTEAGLTREQMAVTLGVSLPTIQRWETGRAEPSFRRVQEIAAATGKPIGWFVAEAVA